MTLVPFDAVVLAGGSARRLGGVDKPALQVGGASLLERVLAAVPSAGRVVVVGPPRALPPEVVQVREQPPGGGPGAALDGHGLDGTSLRPLLRGLDVVRVPAADAGVPGWADCDTHDDLARARSLT